MVVGEPVEQASGLVDLLGRDAHGRFCSSSCAISVHLPRIFGQSSTTSRTSDSTRRRLAAISSRSCGSLSRSISRCIHDSRITPNSGAAAVDARVGSPGRAPPRAPAALRRTSMSGCTTMWTVRPMRRSSAVTESTRKGMSSVTIWTTCVPARPAPLLHLGVEDVDIDGPDGTGLRQPLVRQGRAQEVRCTGQEVLGGDVPEVAAQERLRRSPPAWWSASSAAECNNC